MPLPCNIIGTKKLPSMLSGFSRGLVLGHRVCSSVPDIPPSVSSSFHLCFTHSGPSLKQVTFQPSCGGLQSRVLCCVWVWGPRIAHTPPVIHWPWAAPFMCKRPGVRGRRGGGEGCWPVPFPFSQPFGHICVKGGGRTEQREEFGEN